MSEFDIKMRTNRNGETSYLLDPFPDRKERSAIQIEAPYGGVEMEFRKLYVTKSGGRGNKLSSAYRWHFNAIQAVQLSTILMEIAESELLVRGENPSIKIISNPDKVSFDADSNWLYEDFKIAEKRVRNRHERSCMVTLFQRMVGLSDDKTTIQAFSEMLTDWANNQGGDYERHLAEQMTEQLNTGSQTNISSS